MLKRSLIYMAALLGLFTGIEGKTNIRLVGSSKSCEGRVEIKKNGEWGTVCEHLIHHTHYPKNKLLALVICRQMGCMSSSAGTEHMTLKSFGSGAGKIFFNHLNCTGRESTLWDCKDEPYYRPYCKSHDTDVGVVCSEQPITVAAPLTDEYVPGFTSNITCCVVLAVLLALAIILLLALMRKMCSYRNALRIRKKSSIDSVYLNIDSNYSSMKPRDTELSGSRRNYEPRGKLPRMPEIPAERHPSNRGSLLEKLLSSTYREGSKKHEIPLVSNDSLSDEDVPSNYDDDDDDDDDFKGPEENNRPLSFKGSSIDELSLPVYVIVEPSDTKEMPVVSNDTFVPSDYDDIELSEENKIHTGPKDSLSDELVPSDYEDTELSQDNKIPTGLKDSLSDEHVSSDYDDIDGLEENQMPLGFNDPLLDTFVPSDYDDIELSEENKIHTGPKDSLSDELVPSDYKDTELSQDNKIPTGFKDSLSDEHVSSDYDDIDGLEENQMPLGFNGSEAQRSQNGAPRPPSGISEEYDEVDFGY
ncbi:uncharacterized protein LOC108700685 isoform X2 [Xenopus laevis]|uniref:Uncharacterized protein LOC108700685 isoform X2 n=1 Tax=Xenopus laevis TaxID=8355 RepID=A0A8J1LLH4_XENLA|nr:uncharacterized protein LOC108700685 isoform X2 [Xenopus laevis]